MLVTFSLSRAKRGITGTTGRHVRRGGSADTRASRGIN